MIRSTANKTIKELIKLKQKKYRQQTKKYLVEGCHLVEEALKYDLVELIISCQPTAYKQKELLVSPEVFAKLSYTKSPQNIMALCKFKESQDIIEGKRYLLLDNLQDPGNIGTIFRTALALGVDQIILSPDCVDIYNDKVIRAGQGAIFSMPWLYSDLKEAIMSLKAKGVNIVGTSLEAGRNIREISRQEKMAFVLGNEGNGMRPELISCCDVNCLIPISRIESLNVAIAGAIIIYHFQ